MYKRWLAVFLCTMMIMLLLPTTVLSAGETTLNISYGDITIGNGTVSGFDNNGIAISIPNSNGYIITGSSTVNTVTVTDGTHNITLSGATIDASAGMSSSFTITGGMVNLTLDGTNTLSGGNGFFGGCAGLNVPSGAIVNITGQSDGTGSLIANGGVGAAGIGGNDTESCGTVTINGGTVTANGGAGNMFNSCGAGIGGGASGAGGTITITGGTVTANGGTQGSGSGGAGIGGGGNTGGDSYADQTAVTISGGNVYAEGGNGGAGIGSGCHGASGSSMTLTGGIIHISGGNIQAIGNQGGAGIGGGYDNNGGKVTITGGNIKATGTNGAANIGAGDGGETNGTLSNGTNYLYLLTLTLDSTTADTPISDFDTDSYTYGINDVKTFDTDKLYFYLPNGTKVNSVTTDEAPSRLLNVSNPNPLLAGSYSAGTLREAPSATIGNVTVSGTTDTAISSQQATISLNVEKFNALAADTDVSSWFTNLPAGLVAKISTAVAANATTATVTFSGTPTATSTAVMTVKLPAASLAGTVDLPVTTNTNAKWNIVAAVITPTATPTFTPTPSPSPTPTASPSPTPTGTPTATPGAPTPSPSATPTGTPTITPTGTPTGAPTFTPTPTVTPSATPIVTATPDPNKQPPKTGDGLHPMLWLLGILISGAGLSAFFIIQRKRRNR